MPTAELETTAQQSATGTTLIEFGIDLAKLELAVAEDCKLTINGLDDKAGYERVDTRRKGYVKQRTGVERIRKEYNEEAQARIKKNNAAAKFVTEIIGRAEDHLRAEVDRIDNERRRIEREKADAEYKAKDERLRAAGVVLDRMVVESLSEDQIATRIAEALELAALRKAEKERQEAAEKERQRLAAEEAARVKAEAEKLAAERAEFARQQAEQEAERKRLQKIEDDKRASAQAELDRQRAELQKQQDEIRRQQEAVAAEKRAAQEKIDADRRAAEQAERDRLAAIELEKQKAAAAEQARIETEQRIERERLAEEKRKAEEAAELKRIEAERPYREQLERLAANVDVIGVPDGPKTAQVKAVLKQAADDIRKIAKAK